MKNRLKTIFRSLRIFTTVALAVSFGILQPSTPFATLAAQSPPSDIARQAILAKFKTQENKYRSEAAAWDSAVRGFASVENMPIKTAADAQKVIAVLESSSAGLNGVHGKTVILAMNTSAFKTGVEEEADRATAKGLQLKIKQAPTEVSRFRGFNDAKSAIKRQLDADAAVFNRVAKKLKEASRLRGALPSAPSPESRGLVVARANYRSLTQTLSASSFITQASFSSLATPMAALPVAELTEPGVGEPAAFQTGVLETALVTAAVLLIGAYAGRRVQDLAPPDDGGPSPFTVCMNRALRTRNSCLRRGDFFADLVCYAVYTADVGICVVLPN